MKQYIISNVALTVSLGIFTVVALNLFFNIIDPTRNYFFISDFGDRVVYYLASLLAMLSFLYVFIHLFRFNFNKTNTLMKQLNRGSYSVYIIHVIIMGLIAVALIQLQIQAFIKFILLTMLTFIASNGIVYVYQRWFKQNVSLRVVTFSILVIALFAFIQFGNKAQNLPENHETESSYAVVELHEAVITGNIEVVMQHINAGSDLDEKDLTGGSSPLISAAVFGKTEIALALIDAGADLNFKNNEGSTPLHTAAFFCRTEIVEALLSKGADKTIKNNAGSTALDSVIGPFEVVKPFYDYFRTALEPMGLTLDDEYLRVTRLLIADLLQN